jgi:ABC transport system ATP-binding/permease protein
MSSNMSIESRLLIANRGRMNETDGTTICPECFAFIGANRDRCLRCRRSLSWIDPRRTPEFHLALATPATPVQKDADCSRRIVALVVEIRWKSASTRASVSVEQEFNDSVLGETLRVRAVIQDREVREVAITHGDLKTQVAVPGVHRLRGDFEIEVWLQASLPTSSTASRPDAIDNELTGKKPLSLKSNSEVTFGRRSKCDYVLRHPHMDEIHFVVCRQPGETATDQYWITDRQGAQPTFVNRRPVLSAALRNGDLVQAGPYAWTFTGEGMFVPAEGIRGCTVVVSAAHLGDRLRISEMPIVRSGQFVAIVGASGAGKSTLLKAIARLPEACGQGDVVRIDGADADDEGPWARQFADVLPWRNSTEPTPRQRIRSQLGYLSQDAFVHESLSPMESLRFIARLRCPGRNLGVDDFERVLRELEIPESRWNARLDELSGGQQKRARIAAELLARPRLLLLDEPGSGLDPMTERNLMRLLRNLSDRGCTIVMVTHGTEFTDQCDRVITVDGGKIRLDRSTDSGEEPQVLKRVESTAWLPPAGQFRVLLGREWALVRRDPVSRLGIPLGVAALFAVVLSVALGSGQIDQFGFFCVLGAIWLGASLGVLAIVGERPVFDHERFLFLRPLPYLAAKTTALATIAAIQAIVFASLLYRLQDECVRVGAARFSGLPTLAVVFYLLELSGLTLGLFISAISGRRKERANLLLPLFMISQIVFSAAAVGESGHVDNAYRDFQMRGAVPESDAADLQRPTTRTITVAVSYLTLSRYGDILMRCFAYHGIPENREGRDYTGWLYGSIAALLVLSSFLFLATLFVLSFRADAWRRSIRSVCAR